MRGLAFQHQDHSGTYYSYAFDNVFGDWEFASVALLLFSLHPPACASSTLYRVFLHLELLVSLPGSSW